MSKTENLADRELIVTRTINAPRELVWEAWTNPKHIVNWWGPNDFITTVEEMDFRVGGLWLHTMTHIDGTRYPNHSIFKEIIYPSKLVYDHGDGERVWFEATVTFEETGSGTLVTIRQLFPSKVSRDEVAEKSGAIEGGKQHLNKLEIYIKENLL
jgi:uncharacterized protein YndB with AHSA1/START domain